MDEVLNGLAHWLRSIYHTSQLIGPPNTSWQIIQNITVKRQRADALQVTSYDDTAGERVYVICRLDCSFKYLHVHICHTHARLSTSHLR